MKNTVNVKLTTKLSYVIFGLLQELAQIQPADEINFSKTEGPQRPCRRGGRNRNIMALPEHGVHTTDGNGLTSR